MGQTPMKPMRQIAFVTDLNKCIGCQTCTVACKKLWTKNESQDYMYWMNVETKPGKGYPKDWEKHGGGYKNGKLQRGTLPKMEDYGIPFQFDYKGRFFEGKKGRVNPTPQPEWSPNWDEEVGKGKYPNTYYFYLPRMCNHCSDPACLKACPTGAIYKRAEDGLVIINQDKCSGAKECIKACPYAACFFNESTGTANKCIGCYPLIEKGKPPVCVGSCAGRARFVGYLDDMNSTVYKLVKKWKVALPLHAEFGTQPNDYYIPPLSPPVEDMSGNMTMEDRVPMSLLKELFGPQVKNALSTIKEERMKRVMGKPSGLMDLLIAKTNKQLVAI